MDTDVLVVGAGPTGLMLANQLVRRGVRVLSIIDRHPGPSLADESARRAGAHPGDLRPARHRWSSAGARQARHGRKHLGARAARWRHVPLGEAGRNRDSLSFHPHPRPGRQRTDHGRQTSRLGRSVQWNTELVGLEQDAGRVTATLKHPDGANGEAHRRVGRRMRRRAQRGAQAERHRRSPARHTSTFFVADARVTGTMVPEEVNAYLWREGFHLFFPMRGRITGALSASCRRNSARQGRRRLDDVIPSMRNEAGDALSISSCSWFSTYRIHHRSAARFRDRRCFLLGRCRAHPQSGRARKA